MTLEARTIIPGFWLNETGGSLQPAILRYLKGDALSRQDIALIRSYFRQWLRGFQGIDIDTLAKSIDDLSTRPQISDWLDRAIEIGIDPL